jgi:hypothetical protein
MDCRALGFGIRSRASPFSVLPLEVYAIVPSWALEPSNLPTNLRLPERGIRPVNATRLVDEMSQDTGIQSMLG